MTAARWISIAGHPFVMATVLVWVTARRFSSSSAAGSAVAAVVIATVIPLAVLMVRQVRRGRWRDVDASDRADRPVLFLVALAGLAALAAWLAVRNPESFLVRGVAVTGSMLIVAAVVTRWSKVSLHLAFASYVASALLMLGSVTGWLVVAVIPPLAWSRLELSRHRPLEIVLGVVLGAAAGALLALW